MSNTRSYGSGTGTAAHLCSRWLLPVATATAVLSSPLAAQGSGAPKAIPVFPGAVSYDAGRRPTVKSIHETLLGLSDGIPLLSSTQQDWYAPVKPEEVEAFYRAQLGGIASSFAQWNALDPRSLAPGRATSVHHQRYVTAGEMLYVYHWYRKEAGGEIVLHELMFAHTIIPVPGGPRTGWLTLIMATTKTYSERAASEAPDEMALGVPVYPGARYDSNASTNTLGSLFVHVFRTGDPVERAVAFYERACGRKALQGAPTAGGTNWYLRPCSDALPDDFIIIEEASEATDAGRTMISVHLTRIPPDRP